MIARRKTIHGPNSIISHSSKLTNAIRLNNNQKPLLRPITAFFPFYVCIYLFKYILLIMLLQLSHFFLPFILICPALSLPPVPTPLSSCPWVAHISSLASPFPMLFLTFPYFVLTIYVSHSLYLFPHSLCTPSHPYSPL